MADQIAAHITDLYACLGDRTRFDAHLDPELTVWESDADRLLTGLAELTALRDRRTPDGPAPLSVAPEALRTEQWGDTGLARYVLRARHDARDDELFRVTDVLRRYGDGWRIVHHHAEATTHQR
ncbi:nuclear transport factor 2 family protein [Actinocatenispora rupis]|uniref:SnoaL-like domain-containing protein n=1 Tax=Actinocatenispora rupis TaxID=519421 RepID=A0A8J3NDQ4_9ACTN|nr:nuclear transport factor 2 family protein [Actinocatenispora rupis]GID15544.1 hypothetical protein Aru02nite_64330 [Actinocatenispora rupis]